MERYRECSGRICDGTVLVELMNVEAHHRLLRCRILSPKKRRVIRVVAKSSNLSVGCVMSVVVCGVSVRYLVS